MILPISNLPSKGFRTGLESVEITPLTLQEILNFQLEYKSTSNIIHKHLILIEKLIFRTPVLRKFPVSDLYMLLGFTCYISTTEEYLNRYTIEFNCPKCQKLTKGTIDLDDVECYDMSEDLKKLASVNFCGKEFFTEIPTIEKFFNLLNTYKHYPNPDLVYKVLMVASLFRDVDENVFHMLQNITLSDVALFEYLFVSMCNPIKPVTIQCKTCDGGAVSVNILDKLTEMFRCLSANTKFDPTRISYL